jgi:hypothetical protein
MEKLSIASPLFPQGWSCQETIRDGLSLTAYSMSRAKHALSPAEGRQGRKRITGKFEARNPKFETNSNDQNILNSKQASSDSVVWDFPLFEDFCP